MVAIQLSGLPPVLAVTEGSTKLVPSRCNYGARPSEDDADGCVVINDEAYKAGTVPGHPQSISDAFRVARASPPRLFATLPVQSPI